jgi:hypothetical protein
MEVSAEGTSKLKGRKIEKLLRVERRSGPL